MLQFKKMVKEKMELLFDGEITLLKTDFWLAALVIFLLGVLKKKNKKKKIKKKSK